MGLGSGKLMDDPEARLWSLCWAALRCCVLSCAIRHWPDFSSGRGLWKRRQHGLLRTVNEQGDKQLL